MTCPMLKLFCVVIRALIMGLMTVPAVALLTAPHATRRKLNKLPNATKMNAPRPSVLFVLVQPVILYVYPSKTLATPMTSDVRVGTI